MQRTTKFLGALAAAAALAACAVKAQDRPPATAPRPVQSVEDFLGDPVVAKGKGFEIKRSRLDEAVARYRSQLVEQGVDQSTIPVPEVEAELLDLLIETQVLNLKATDAQKTRGREEGEKRFESVKKFLGTEDALLRRMKAINTTPEIFHQRILEDSIRNTVLHERFHIPDDQLKKYYDENPSKFVDPETARVTHILMTTVELRQKRPLSEDEKKIKRQQIEGLLKRARAGEDFAKLAKEYSEDPTARENGGEVTIIRGDRGIPREFEAAAFTLQTNQISDVVTSSLGFHLIKLKERIPGKTNDLATATVALRNALEEREIEKAKSKFMAELKQENSVEILDPGIKQVQASLKILSASRDDATNAPPLGPK